MRTLLVGCGDHGGNTLLPAALSAGLGVVAVADSSRHQAQLVAQQWSVPTTYATLEACNPADFDCVLIALPVTAQADALQWALGNGLNTFVEKPPAPDLRRLHDLVDLAGQRDLVCVVGMNFRWAEGVLRLLEHLDSGRFGHVVMSRVVHLARKPVVSFSPDLSIEASLFHAQGIHAIDLAQLFFAGDAAVSGQMLGVDRGRFCALAGDDASCGRRYETHFGSCAAGFYHHLEILTSTGDLLQLRNLSELVLQPNGGDSQLPDYPGARVLWRRSPIGVGFAEAGYTTELAAFRSACASGVARRLARLADLIPVYQAFDGLLTCRGLKWTN